MRFIRHLFLCCAFVFASVSVYAQNLIESLIVVTDSQHPVTNIPPDISSGTQVIYLDAFDEINNQFFDDLSFDSVQAEKTAREKLEHIDQTYQNALKSALQGAVDAWVLWRPYNCCQKRGQVFLGSIGY